MCSTRLMSSLAHVNENQSKRCLVKLQTALMMMVVMLLSCKCNQG